MRSNPHRHNTGSRRRHSSSLHTSPSSISRNLRISRRSPNTSLRRSPSNINLLYRRRRNHRLRHRSTYSRLLPHHRRLNTRRCLWLCRNISNR